MKTPPELPQPGARHVTKRKPMKRASVACSQCRSTHLKCDSTKPVCLRCREEGRACVYLKSRRGGAARSKTFCGMTTEKAVQDTQLTMPSPSNWTFLFESFDAELELGHFDELIHEKPQPNLSSCQYLRLYYQFFHDAHPCVPPRQHLERLLKTHANVQPLLAVMRYIGSIFSSSPSDSFRAEAWEALTLLDTTPSGFSVQARLLFSIGLYWSGETDDSRQLLSEATQIALSLGMQRRGFVEQNSDGGLVMEESWRRTWWLLFIIDINAAASSHQSRFVPNTLSISTELPCEEDEYKSGTIPLARTLDEYASRGFTTDDVKFSSFAHLVGMYQVLAAVIDGDSTAKPSSQCDYMDAFSTSWLLLLPSRKRAIVQEDGKLDVLIFQACLVMYTVLIGLHRPLSKLDYNSLESKSRCAPSETPELITFMDDRIPNFHSAKIIHALGEQFRILSLSNGFVQHSPFITCMLANSTIAQMSACLYFLKGEQLTLARERLRATMGILGEFARVWSLGGRTLRELKYIAQEAFRLPTVARSLTAHLTIESNPQDELQESWGLDTSWFEESDLAMAATLDGIEGPVQQSFITI